MPEWLPSWITPQLLTSMVVIFVVLNLIAVGALYLILLERKLAAWIQESWSLPPAYTVTCPADPEKAEATCALAGKAYVARHRGWFATVSRDTARAPRWWPGRLRKSA